MKRTALVSACLLGINCRYNGRNKRMKDLAGFLEEFLPVPVCPEQMGGLPTPRPPANFYGGDGRDVLCGRARIINEDGEDVTDRVLRGCRECLKLVELLGIEVAVLKDRSPACGVENIWIGEDCVKGSGVLKPMLQEKGVKILRGDDF
ncbi:MAG: DUF523 domain-containing protein [Deferribacteres bacterium]|nr:DUF523 domain-containing protein [Deferribacteres bacterium]